MSALPNSSRQPVDLEACPSHITGSAVLHAADGSIARPCTGKMTEKVLCVVFIRIVMDLTSAVILFTQI